MKGAHRWLLFPSESFEKNWTGAIWVLIFLIPLNVHNFLRSQLRNLNTAIRNHVVWRCAHHVPKLCLLSPFTWNCKRTDRQTRTCPQTWCCRNAFCNHKFARAHRKGVMQWTLKSKYFRRISNGRKTRKLLKAGCWSVPTFDS